MAGSLLTGRAFLRFGDTQPATQDVRYGGYGFVTSFSSRCSLHHRPRGRGHRPRGLHRRTLRGRASPDLARARRARAREGQLRRHRRPPRWPGFPRRRTPTQGMPTDFSAAGRRAACSLYAQGKFGDAIAAARSADRHRAAQLGRVREGHEAARAPAKALIALALAQSPQWRPGCDARDVRRSTCGALPMRRCPNAVTARCGAAAFESHARTCSRHKARAS